MSNPWMIRLLSISSQISCIDLIFIYRKSQLEHHRHYSHHFVIIIISFDGPNMRPKLIYRWDERKTKKKKNIQATIYMIFPFYGYFIFHSWLFRSDFHFFYYHRIELDKINKYFFLSWEIRENDDWWEISKYEKANWKKKKK